MGKHTSKEIRKMVFKYTVDKQRFTQIEMKRDLKLTDSNSSSATVSAFMTELVSWEYLTAIKEGSTVLYYRI